MHHLLFSGPVVLLVNMETVVLVLTDVLARGVSAKVELENLMIPVGIMYFT